jgi:hypothetical protein
VSRTLAVTTLPQSALAEAASAEAALAEAALVGVALVGVALASAVDSVVALASIVDLDPAPSPSTAVSDLGLDSVVALASIVDLDPAPSPSIAVSDLGLAFTVDSIAGLHSVDLVVDGKIDADWRVDRQQDATHEASIAGVRLEGQPISRGRRGSGQNKRPASAGPLLV